MSATLAIHQPHGDPEVMQAGHVHVPSEDDEDDDDDDEPECAAPAGPNADLEDVLTLTKAIEKKNAEFAECKEHAKTIRAELKGLQLERERLLHGLSDGQPSLYDTIDTAKKPDETMAWRNDPLLTALRGLHRSLLFHLHKAELRTMGELAEWTGAGEKRLTDIPGIGEAAAEKIEKCLEAYWERARK